MRCLAVEVCGERQPAGEGPSLCYLLARYQTAHATSQSLHLQNEDDKAYFPGCGVTRKIYIYEVPGPGEGEAWRK